MSSRKTYSEHGFEARISPSAGHVCHSLVVSWNCMPGSAQSQAASQISSHSSRARSVAARLRRRGPPRARARARCARRAATSSSLLDRAHEAARDAHRVVRVLARDRLVGLALPVGVVLVDAQLAHALAREVERALDRDVRDAGAARARARPGRAPGWSRATKRSLALGLARSPRRSRSGAARASASRPRARRPSSPRRPSSGRNAAMSGWSRSSVTIFAARRVVPPDLIAPAARSPILRKLIRPRRACRRPTGARSRRGCRRSSSRCRSRT